MPLNSTVDVVALKLEATPPEKDTSLNPCPEEAIATQETSAAVRGRFMKDGVGRGTIDRSSIWNGAVGVLYVKSTGGGSDQEMSTFATSKWTWIGGIVVSP